MAITYTGTNKKIAENILSKGGNVVSPETEKKTGMFSTATTATKTTPTTTTPQVGADKWGANAEKVVVPTVDKTQGMYSDASTIAEQSKGLTYKYMSEEVPEGAKKSPYQSQQEAFTKMMEEQATTVNALSEQYKSSFSKLQTMLGEQTGMFEEQLKKYQAAMKGGQVDITNPTFQEEMRLAVENGQTDFSSIFDRYRQSGNTPNEIQELMNLGQQAVGLGLDPQRAQEAIQSASERGVPAQSIKDYFNEQIKNPSKPQAVEGEQAPQTEKDISFETPISSDNLNPPTEDVKTTKEKVVGAMESINQMTPSSLEGALSSANVNLVDMTSPEGIATMLLQQGLDYAEDDSIKNWLLNQADVAQSSYESALASYQYSLGEIDKAIMGDEFTPMTSTGLTAKVYAQSKEMGLESIEAEKQYRSEQYNIWRQQEGEKRGRLEGYLKAKLVAMGAEDSSAGLSMMALQVNAADLRIQQAESEYNYGLSQLNMQSREIMMSFSNNIAGLIMQADSQKSEAMSAYQSSISDIEKQLIADDREKNKLRMETLSKYQDQMYKIDQDRKAQEWKEKEFAYKQIRDTVDDAYKLSGLSGTIYGVDENGNVFDSGIPTFEASKWEQSNLMDQMRFQHTVENDAFNQAMKMLETYGSSASGLVEQALGMPEGTLSQYQTLEEQKNATENWFSSLSLSAGTSGVNNPIASAYDEGYQPSKMFKGMGLQCGEFIHKFMDINSMGNSLGEKKRNFMNRDKSYIPKVGDAGLTSEHPTYGHVFMINEVDLKNRKFKITEANYAGAGVVTNDRWMSFDDPKLIGYHTGNLKKEYATQLQNYNSYGTEIESKLKEASKVLEGMAGKDKSMLGGVFATIGAVMGKTGDEMNPIMSLSNKMISDSVDILASDNPFITDTQKTDTAQSFLDGLDPMQASLIKLYNDQDPTALAIVKDMTDSDRKLFNQMSLMYKMSLPTVNENKSAEELAKSIMDPASGATLKDLTPTKKAEVLPILTKMKNEALKSGDLFGVMSSSAGGSQLTQTTFDSLSKGFAVIDQLSQLSGDIAEGSNSGPLLGQLAKRNPFDTKAQKIQAELISITPTLARGVYGEVGVLTDADVKLYQNTLPNLTQTQDVQQAVLALTLRTVKNSLTKKVELAARSGYDVSGLTPMMRDLNFQIQTIEEGLGISQNSDGLEELINQY